MIVLFTVIGVYFFIGFCFSLLVILEDYYETKKYSPELLKIKWGFSDWVRLIIYWPIALPKNYFK